MKTTALLLWTVLCVLTGGALFKIAFEVERMEEALTQINREIAKEQEALHVLEAEWAYLTRPSRLGVLSAEFLPDLGPPQIEQITTVSETPKRMEAEFKIHPSHSSDIGPGTETPFVLEKAGAE